MKYNLLIVFLCLMPKLSALDQLPEELFDFVLQPLVYNGALSDPFNLILTNKQICYNIRKWWDKETNPKIMEKMLYKACRQDPWTVAFVVRFNEATPDKVRITDKIVYYALDPYQTPEKSQRILSKKFPAAFRYITFSQDKEDHDFYSVEILIRNGFNVLEVSPGWTHMSVPVLQELVRCRAHLQTVKILLEHKHNPSYHYTFNYGLTVTAISLAQKSGQKECLALLEQYKREPENTKDMIYPD